MKSYRYKVEFPNVPLNSSGYPQVYCAPESADWENLKWLRFGSGGSADARHCFVDDWRIEHLWRRQGQGLAKAIIQGILTAPDFTIERNFPFPLAQYQVWRSGVIAKYWQKNGVTVVPVLQWGNSSTWDLPLNIIVQGSVVAVRGPQKGTEREWLQAALYFKKKLKPSLVLHFGRQIDCWSKSIFLPLNSKKR